MAFFEIGYPENLESFPNVKRSFGDIAGATILGDVGVMAIGYMIVFVYVMFMLGKFNCLELRSHLSFAGIMGVIMGIVVSYGFCSAVNLFFGPMHSVLPFLLLGKLFAKNNKIHPRNRNHINDCASMLRRDNLTNIIFSASDLRPLRLEKL